MKKTGAKKRVLQIVLGLFVALLAIEVVVYFYPPLIVYGYAILGRSPFCPPLQAFHGAQVSARMQGTKKQYESSKDAFVLAETDSKGFHRWHTPDGDYWILGQSDKVLRVLLAQQNSNIYGTGKLGVMRGDIVLDCGAHVGVFVRKAIALGASKVIAIEPGPENLECLRRNFRDEIARGVVVVYPKGVWDDETVLKFHTFPGNTAADSFFSPDGPSQGEVHELAVTTIDKILDELSLKRVDFIKLDIKGSTEKALLGGQMTLKAYKPRLAISTEEVRDNPATIISLVERIQPAYLSNCGYCAIEGGRVLPMTVLFR